MASRLRIASSKRFQSTTPTASSPSPSSAPPLATQILLHRRPFLSPPQPEHVRAIHAYNYKLRHALSSPFPTDMYLKKGSMAMKRFTYERAVAERDAFGRGIPEEVELVEKDVASLEIVQRGKEALGEKEKERGFKSLVRSGENSLYLVVKGREGWRFPGGLVDEGGKRGEIRYGDEVVENPRLDQIARENLHTLLGPNLSVWPVGRLPIAYVPSEPKTFIFKSHILAGQPVVSELATKQGVQDFAWLTKQEIREKIAEEGSEEGRVWWESVEGLLNEF